MELKVTPWLNKEEIPSEEALRDQLEDQDLKVYHWSSRPGHIFAGHTHGYHKVLYVLKGSIKFDLPTRHQTLNLTSGDRLDLPTGIRHSAVVGDEGVACLEAHIY